MHRLDAIDEWKFNFLALFCEFVFSIILTVDAWNKQMMTISINCRAIDWSGKLQLAIFMLTNNDFHRPPHNKYDMPCHWHKVMKNFHPYFLKMMYMRAISMMKKKNSAISCCKSTRWWCMVKEAKNEEKFTKRGRQIDWEEQEEEDEEADRKILCCHHQWGISWQ